MPSANPVLAGSGARVFLLLLAVSSGKTHGHSHGAPTLSAQRGDAIENSGEKATYARSMLSSSESRTAWTSSSTIPPEPALLMEPNNSEGVSLMEERTLHVKMNAEANPWSTLARSAALRRERKLMNSHIVPIANMARALTRLQWTVAALMAIGTTAVVAFMMTGNHSNSRNPPPWNPANQSTYPFREWAHDVLIWSISSEMDSRRKAAAVIGQLRGAARNFIRTVPTNVRVAGGMIGGARADPMSYLMHTLAAQFNELGEERSLRATMDLVHFGSQAGETIDMLLARFEEVRSRAANEGQVQLNVSHTAATLLGAVGISTDQYQRLLEPTGGLPVSYTHLTLPTKRIV